MNPGDLSDDELLTMLRAPADSVPRQRARAGRTRPDPNEPRLGGLSDEELLAALGKSQPKPAAPPEAPAYRLTDYAGENKAGPLSEAQQAADARLAADPMAEGDPVREDPRWQRLTGHTPDDEAERERQAQGRGFAHFALGGLTGMAVGPALAAAGAPARVAGAAGGVAAGGVQAAAEHAPARDIIESALLGGVLGAATGGDPRGAPARPPRTQAELDAAALARAEIPKDLPPGARGATQLAEQAANRLAERLDARGGANKSMINEADQDYAGLDATEGPVPTFGLRQRLQDIRGQSLGGSGPTLDSDPVLARMQGNLETPDPDVGGAVPEVTRPQLRNVHKALNEEANFAAKRGATMAEGALQQGAGAVSDRVRTADPRLAPGNIGGALDRYGAEKDAISDVDRLAGAPGSRVSRFAGLGSADADSSPASIHAENDIRELMGKEPVSNDLLDIIQAINTKERRGLRLPTSLIGGEGMTALRALRANASNLNFHLNRPQIDAEGNVAARPVTGRGYSLAVPLELQLLLDEKEGRQ